LVFVLGVGRRLYAEDPTSKFTPLAPLASLLPASSTSNAVQFEVWDQATGGTMISTEAHTVDTDVASNISNDTGFADLLLGRPGGLVSANFPAGTSRYLDVTQGGISVLTARVPLYASAFTISAPNEIPGNLTLVNSSATAGNILKDGALFLHNFGNSNTFLGSNAGNLTMTGSLNTASGTNALANNTSGTDNTAMGNGALRSNTSGNFNTANGASALFNNTTGKNNTASGFFALFANSAGGNNTANGSNALANTTGSDNTANGFDALFSNTVGTANTATGSNTLLVNASGNNNTASGANALKNNTGSNNTATGFQALTANTVGISNAASGNNALANNTTGSSNTASGNNALALNSTGDSNTANGDSALVQNTTGRNNTAVGRFADVSVGNLVNSTAIGYAAVVNASDKIRLGNAAVTVIEGQVPYTFTSDKNQKENFQPVEGEQVLSKIRGLKLTSWNYIGHDPKQFRHYGPMAQEFFGAFGQDGVGTIGTSTTINSGDMEGILMVAVQALEKRTGEFRQENEVLKVENAELKARLEVIERKLSGNANHRSH